MFALHLKWRGFRFKAVSEKKLWLIKDRRGKILGPFAAKEIEAYIEEGRFQGEELLSPYPLGRWRPLSAHPAFYAKILGRLSAGPDSPPGGRSRLRGSKPKQGPEGPPPEEEDEALEATIIMRGPSKKKPSAQKSEKKRKKVKISFEKEDDDESSEIIEMEEKSSATATARAFGGGSGLRGILIFAALAAAGLVFLLKKEPQREDQQVRLAGPSGAKASRRPPLTDKQLEKKTREATGHYLKDSVPHYLNAQEQLSQILESRPKFKQGYYYLCLAHLELWPFAYQDTKDKKTLFSVLEKINKIDQGGVYAGLCSSASELISGKWEKALMTINSSLDILGMESPAFFYYLKARALSGAGREREAAHYLQTIYNLAPKWAAPHMLAAEARYKEGSYSAAAKKYQKILSIVPEHKAAGLRLGVLEFKYFKKAGKGEKRLKSVLTGLSELINPQILSEAYMAMAQIRQQQNDREEALSYAKKAYALDPVNPKIEALVSSLGGESGSIKKTRLETRQLIYRGDMLMGQGQLKKAQAYYEKAYRAGGQKNSLAAIRMAKSFHQRGGFGQAVLWLRRAVAADYKMSEAYFLLADYLSEKYDFEGAREALRAAKKSRPSRYEILKSHALLAFRQKIYSHAISYAKQAAEAYSADPEVYVLLHDALAAAGSYSEAFKAAERAKDSDVNSVPGQIAYAKALGSAYGFGRGQKHFEELMQLFPMILEYRQAYGEYFFNHGKYSEAENVFAGIARRRPEFKPPLVYLGRIYGHFGKRDSDEGQFKTALNYLLKASLLDTSDPEPLFYMGWIYMQAERHHEAERQFERALALNPGYPQINYYIGLMNFLQGGGENLDRAMEAARAEIQKNPRSSLAYILAGDIYRRRAAGAHDSPYRARASYELCAKEYQKALKIQKSAVSLQVKLIGCYRGSGDLDSAIQIADQVIGRPEANSHPEIYRQLGAIYEAKSDYENAKAIYKIYFSLMPNAEDRAEIERRIQSYVISAPAGGEKRRPGSKDAPSAR